MGRSSLKQPSRSILIIALVAVAIGLVEPSIELAWKCRAGFEASEGCVWGKSYMPLSRALGMLIIAPVAFGILMMIRRAWRPTTTAPSSRGNTTEETD